VAFAFLITCDLINDKIGKVNPGQVEEAMQSPAAAKEIF
jgi:hypothetical protein